MVKLLCVWRSCQHEAATEGFGKSAECETSWSDSVRFSSDGDTLRTPRLLHLAARVTAPAPAVARAGVAASVCTRPRPDSAAKPPSSASALNSPAAGSDSTEEGYSKRGGGKALQIAAVQPSRAHLSEPLKQIQSQDGGFPYKSSSFSLVLFSSVCL